MVPQLSSFSIRLRNEEGVAAARGRALVAGGRGSVVAALRLPTFFRPVQEVFHLGAVPPREAEEFGGVEIGGFGA